MRYAVRIGLAVLSILLPSIALAQPEWKLPHGPNTASGHTGTGVVSIDGDFVVVGDPEDDQICPADSADCDAGAAHLYQLIDGDWRHVKRLEDPVPSSGNKFGQTVAVGGDYVLVSSYRDYATPESPLAGAGFVYYRHQGGTDNWGLQKKLKPDHIDPDERVEFGKTLDISPDYAALSYFDNGGVGRRVYLYGRDRDGAGNWGELRSFGASTFDRRSKPGTIYGGAIALGGEYLFVGDGETGGNGNAPGSIYFYRIEADSVKQMHRVINPITNSRTHFGTWLSFDEANARVAVGDADNPERVFVFGVNFSLGDSLFLEQEAQLDIEGANTSLYGHYVALSGDRLIMGAPLDKLAPSDSPGFVNSAGAAYLFERRDGQWAQTARLLVDNPVAHTFFARTLDISGDYAVFGSNPRPDEGREAAYILHLTPQPVQTFSASDETGSDFIQLEWEPVSDDTISAYYADSLLVYRDGELRATLDGTTRNFIDIDEGAGGFRLAAGEVHSYCIRTVSDLGLSEPVCDAGRTLPNGRINGQVSAVTGGTVPDLDVCVDAQFDRAVDLDGNGALDLPDRLNDGLTDFTFEAWVQGSGTVFSLGRDEAAYLRLSVDADGLPRFAVTTDGAGAEQALQGATALAPETWHHLAVSLDDSSGSGLLLVDGEVVARGEIALTPHDLGATQDNWLGRGPADTRWTGSIDEARLWNTALDETGIAASMRRTVSASAAGLWAYWRLDAGRGEHAYDYSRNGRHGLLDGAQWTAAVAPVRHCGTTDGNGNYSILGISYGLDATFAVRPDTTGGRVFSPNETQVSLNSISPFKDGIGFVDESSFTVSGRVLYAGTSCGVDSLDLVFSGQTFPTVATTDPEGRFEVGLQIGDYTAATQFHGHSFDPDSLRLEVRGDIEGLSILDTTRHTLSGKIVGGVCEAPLGRATVQISAAAGCLDTTLTVEGTEYGIELPAQEYVVQVSLPDNPLVQFAPRAVSLLDSSVTADFVHRAAPRIAVTGFPQARCDVPVLDQGQRYTLRVSVTEEYGDATCRADSGLVSVFDGIGDTAAPLEVELDSTGAFNYPLNAGSPNILAGGRRPYQKSFQVEARTGGGESVFEQWAIVTGSRPREQTFVTVSPEVPLLILRDPPGDASYSYLEENTTTCHTTGMSFISEAGVTAYSEIKTGHAFETGLEVFKVSYAEERSTWGTIGGSLEVVGKVQGQSRHEMCITASNRFSTSDNPLVTGSGGDVFVGAALNMVYALTDVLEVNESCQVELSKSIMYSPNGFDTWYVYTEDHIRNVLVPDLETLRDLEEDADKRLDYQDQIDVWRQTLDLNASLKRQAEPIGGAFENISFSANARVENFTEISETGSHSIDFSLDINETVSGEVGFDIAGKGARKGGSVRARLLVGSSTSDDTTQTNRVGFVLFDDDPGDFYSVNVKADPNYGTPVFDLVAGESSAPWERGTLPREGVQIGLDAPSRNDVDPDGQAAFRLSLGNNSQSDETRTYEVAVLQESNPDGAEISIGGVVVERALSFTIPAGQVVETTLAVGRGPVAYDYEDISLVLRSPVDPEQIADTTSFTVRYRSPCSGVSLIAPQSGWAANSGSGDSLVVALADYERERLSNIALQYSPAGRNTWRTASLVPRGELAEGEDLLAWRFGNIEDGAYDLRAVVNCDAGVSYSAQASGSIDRQAPGLSGDPQPADGIWEPGDAIAANFDEALDCDTIAPPTARLRRARDGESVPAVFSCSGAGILVSPQADPAEIEDEVLQVVLEGLGDPNGNRIPDGVSWSFRVNRNPVGWAPTALDTDIQPASATALHADLVNSGAQAADFSLLSWPEWLEPEPLTGTVEAGGRRRIRLALAPDAPTGLLEGDVVAQTPDGTERLPLRLQARCPAPDWTVDFERFDAEMNLVGTFYADGESIGGPGDRVAAFVGDEVRGVAEVQRIVPQDEFAGFLTIHGFAAADRPVELRLWDASECSIRLLERTLAFTPDSTLGRADQPDSLHLTDAPLQRLLLEDTWNWISLRLQSLDMSLDALTQRLGPRDGDLIKSQTRFSQYVAGRGWVGNLDSLQSATAYKVRLAAAEDRGREWVLLGSPVPQTQALPLNPGWNWIGYLPPAPLPVSQALAGLPSTAGDQVKGPRSFAGYDGQSWVGSLATLEPGHGYLLKRSATGALAYPATEAAKTAATTQAAWQVDETAFEHSMNLIARLAVEGVGSTSPSLQLGVFSGESCRGVAEPVFVLDRWQYFVTIHGDSSGQALSLRALDTANGEEWKIDAELSFEADAVLGAPERPLALDASPARQVIDSGDFDGDGQVGFPDFFVFVDVFGQPAAGDAVAYDLDGDGQIGFGDFFLFAERFNTGAGKKAGEAQPSSDRLITLHGREDGGTYRLRVVPQHPAGTAGYGLLLRYDAQAIRFDRGIAAGGTLLARPLAEGRLLLAYGFAAGGPAAPVDLLFDAAEGAPAVTVEQATLRLADGSVVAAATDLSVLSLPRHSALGANYPNPFNPETAIPYQIGAAGPVRLEIYDILGQKVRTLAEGPLKPGHYRTVWDGRDDRGEAVASGVYLSRLWTQQGTTVGRLLLLK